MLDNSQRVANKKQKQVGDEDTGAKKPRNRVCVKCGVEDCGGRQGAARYCKNPCQDCQDTSCVGRNAKHPRKTCQEGKKYGGITGGRKGRGTVF